jgi:PAS domain S-box-containing protein
MRTSTLLNLLAIILISAVVALIGWMTPTSSAWGVWILRGVVIVLCIGILLTGGAIRSIRLKEQSNSVENELSLAEARFQAFFNDPAVGIGILGLDRRLVDANLTFFRMFGRTREEMIGLNAAEVTYPDDDPLSAKMFAELFAGKRDSYEADRRYIRKNGEVFWAHATMTIVRGSDNVPRYLVGMLMDVDKQKRDALALAESEARFRAAFESSAIGMALMTIDGHFLKANAAVRKISGYTEEELEQLTSDDIAYPGEPPVGLDLFAEMMEGKRSYYQVERRYVRKNREVFWTRLTLSAVHDTQGNIVYLVALVEDIDEQKRTLAKLKKSEARFQAVFENAAVGISIISLEGKLLAINPVIEQISGYNETELSQMNPVELMLAEDQVRDADLYQELIEGKRSSFVAEVRYRHKDGALYWVRVNYSMVYDPGGIPDYMIALVENIDDEKRAAEKLAAQEAEYLLTLKNRVRERTHELEEANQLLQKEIGQRTRIEKELAEKAADEAVAADRTRLARDLHDAVTQTLFSSSLIAEVLPDLWEMDTDEAKRSTEELRQLTRGALAEMRTLLLELRPATLTQTHLTDLIKQLCEAFIGRSRLPIVLNIEGDRALPPEVQVAFYRIAQESLNNVFKYARATEVNVSLLISSTTVRFEVCDNGVGFDTSASKPLNLGTSIMRERAEAIGADFHISSTLGSGTCVDVTWNENPNPSVSVL